MEPFGQLVWIDWVIVGVLLLSSVISFVRGFVREGLSLFSWVLALWLAIQHTAEVSAWLAPKLHYAVVRLPLSFLLILVPVLIVCGLLSRFMVSLIQKLRLGLSDHLIGACFGFLRGILIVSILLLLARKAHFQESEWWRHSQLIPQFHVVLAWVAKLPHALGLFHTTTSKTGA